MEEWKRGINLNVSGVMINANGGKGEEVAYTVGYWRGEMYR